MGNELSKMVEQMQVSYYPENELDKSSLDSKQKFPMSQLAALGVAFQPIMQGINFVLGSGQGGSGLYFVDTMGTKMHRFANEPAFLGSLKNAAGGVGGGQARLYQLPIDPTMLFMAMALISVEQKLDSIEKTQKEILAFLELREEAKLKGDLNTLIDIQSNYKFNWDNEKYKTNKHILVQQIRRDSEHSIILYREQLVKCLGRNTVIHSDHNVKLAMSKASSLLNDYHLALYIFSFSSFLEVMLLENFDSGYLGSITDKIAEYKDAYTELYTMCYDRFEKDSGTSLQSYALRGLSVVSSKAGKLIEKIPVISKSQIDEGLIKAGDKLTSINADRMQSVMQTLSDSRCDAVDPFVENINAISSLYNKPIELCFDEENIYFGFLAA